MSNHAARTSDTHHLPRHHRRHRIIALGLALLLIIIHHDFWFWDSRELVAGFLPVGLAYHMLFSLAAALLWVYAIFFAWPVELEDWANTGQPQPQPQPESHHANAPSSGERP